MSLPAFPSSEGTSSIHDQLTRLKKIDEWKLEHEKRLHEFCELVEPAIYKDYDSESIKKYEEKKKSLLEPNK